MEEVKILNITSQLSIDVVRKDIKNMHLAVYPPTGRVRIAAPLRIDDEAVRLFAISKISWIRKHQRNFLEQDRQPPRQFKERESHYFQGKRYLLRVIEHEAPPKVVFKTKTYIDLHIRPNSTTEQRQIIINEWYRTELKKLIQPIIDKWEKQIGVTVADWQVKQMKTKWGTCNIEKKRIWIEQIRWLDGGSPWSSGNRDVHSSNLGLDSQDFFLSAWKKSIPCFFSIKGTAQTHQIQDQRYCRM